MDLSKTMIESGRLRLVPISPKYREDIFREFTDEITTFMRAPTPKSIADTDAFIEKSQKESREGSELVLVTTDKITGEFIGCCGIHKTNTPLPEFGIWIKKTAQGKKYGGEIVRALKRWVEDTMEFEQLVYHAAKENIRSRKIAESLGGIPVKEFLAKKGNGTEVVEVEYHIPHA